MKPFIVVLVALSAVACRHEQPQPLPLDSAVTVFTPSPTCTCYVQADHTDSDRCLYDPHKDVCYVERGGVVVRAWRSTEDEPTVAAELHRQLSHGGLPAGASVDNSSPLTFDGTGVLALDRPTGTLPLALDPPIGTLPLTLDGTLPLTLNQLERPADADWSLRVIVGGKEVQIPRETLRLLALDILRKYAKP